MPDLWHTWQWLALMKWHDEWINEWNLTNLAVASSHEIKWWMIERINEHKNECIMSEKMNDLWHTQQ